MTGVSYATSAEMAGELGAFPGLRAERRAHAARHPQPSPRRLWRDHGYEGLTVNPVPLDHADCPTARWSRPPRAWDRRWSSARSTATATPRSTVIAPTGTIGLVMDCDTTGIEPDFALVKFKKLAGGGYFKIINRAVPGSAAHARLSEGQIAEIEAYAVGHGTLNQAPASTTRALRPRASPTSKIERSSALKSAFDIKFVFNQWTLGEDFCKQTLGVTDEQLERLAFDLLPRSASPAPTSRPPTSMSAAR
jgi:ribonucleoside-diphosphate reductase alpha chain